MPSRRDFIQQMAATGLMTTASVSIAQAAGADSTSRHVASLSTRQLPNTRLSVSRIAYGCGGLVSWNRDALGKADVTEAARIVQTAYENGITLFDHADVYGYGKAESAFGQVLKQSSELRNRIVVQSKCGQVFSDDKSLGVSIGVDLSREHIVRSVEGTLQRLGIDRLDILLLHAPDTLVDPSEVSEAFATLERDGKVSYFGVSNFNANQIQLLKKYVRQPIVINQIRISLANAQAIIDGMEFTLKIAKSKDIGGDFATVGTGTLDYCRSNDIQIQAWSPLRGVLSSSQNASPSQQRTLELLTALATRKQTTPSAVALAWLLRHPAGIVPVIGATKAEHIRESCASDRVPLSREEWYALLASATELASA